MELVKLKKYVLNGFILLLPIFLWNIIFFNALPRAYSSDIFWNDIPSIISYVENITRIIVFALPAIMILSLETKLQRFGLILYVIGVIVYFISWAFQIYLPDSYWSKSILGFMAPAYTTIIWFVGIGMVGRKSFVNIPYLSLIYFSVTTLFVLVHSLHTYLVFQSL